MTMQVIQHIELGSAQASITFNSIANTFTDLLLVVSPRSAVADVADGLFMTFNGSTSGYSARDLFGSGSSAGSSTNPYGRTNAAFLGSNAGSTATSNTFGSVQCYIPNYASSNQKSFSIESVMENNATLAYMDVLASLWTGTAAISSINIFWTSTSNFAAGSSATLYGITKGSDGITTVS